MQLDSLNCEPICVIHLIHGLNRQTTHVLVLLSAHFYSWSDKVNTKGIQVLYLDNLLLLQLAGVVAVEVTGGPDISFQPGRKVGSFFFFFNNTLR